MKNRWSNDEAQTFLDLYAPAWGEDLALRTYSSRLLGSESSLVLHGGGNTSVKGVVGTILGEEIPAIYVKASGWDLAKIEPEGHAGVDLNFLRRLKVLHQMSDDAMVREIRSHLLDYRSPTPSIETLVHAFLPAKFIDHSHADAILALTNQLNGFEKVREALGDDVIIVDYVKPGFDLAKASSDAWERHSDKSAMVWMRHGLVTWGETAQASYSRMIDLVSRAEEYLDREALKPSTLRISTERDIARSKWRKVAPLLRGLLAESSGDDGREKLPVILTPLQDREVLDFLDSEGAREIALTPPLTSDHLIRTKVYPLWIEELDCEDEEKLRKQLKEAVAKYRSSYEKYVSRYEMEGGVELKNIDSSPRVVLVPGIGGFCSGSNIDEAEICRDIMEQTLCIKVKIAAMGTYQGIEEPQLFAMEYRGLQHAKLSGEERPLGRLVAVVTGAAGAIGSGVCRGLLDQGCHVAVTDLPGQPLDSLVDSLKQTHGNRVVGVPLDVTDPESVASGFDEVVMSWGGIDLVIINAGIALVSSLSEMDLEAFRRLEKVNVEGTLLLLAESGRVFERQDIGGDIVLISTKNVFAPGARFGAYSATKAGSHQLARIASLELAPIGVRVNMVSPDAIFGEGSRKSGLWAEVGPDRMRARGMDENELQEYYRSRNLLKSRITAEHVANAVLYFATRQSPTTGATIPVDGGLPDATPR
jgi:rhamnose utilization protein RhaD (predicted bifunctional aldolase and dehydrogenase)/NAD(P)-dependent dehydrogenase (short-subunit alcohol dehydrogenase family)